jgi:hypothetical protein
MGGKGMSNLDEQIDAWRQGLLGRDVVASVELDELEDHLRQEMERLSKLGLSDHEAFLVATQRLGNTEALSTEYSKVSYPELCVRRLQWMLVGYLSICMIGRFVDLLAGSVSSMVLKANLPLAWFVSAHAVTILLLTITVLWGAMAFLSAHSGSVHQLVTRYGNYLSQHLAVGTVAMVVTTYLLSFLGNSLFSSQLAQIRANTTYNASGYDFISVFSSRHILSLVWSVGLPIGLAVLTVWMRRRSMGGDMAR